PAKEYDRRLVGGRNRARRPFPGPLDPHPIRSADPIRPGGTDATAGALVRTRPAMERRVLRPSPPEMRTTLLILNQEFELFGRDPVSVLRVVLDDGLAARPRMLGSRVRLPGRSRRSAAPAARPIPLPRLPRAMGSWPPRALPPGRLRVRPRRRRPAPGATRVVVLLAAPNRRRTFGPVGAERTLRRDPGLGVGIRPRGSVSGALDGLHRKAGIIPR